MADYYFYNNSANNDWSDTNNWSTVDEPGAGPSSLPSDGDGVFIRQTCSVNVPTTLNYITTVSNGAEFDVPDNSIMDSSFSLSVESGGIVNFLGNFNFSGTFNVYNGGTANVTTNIFDPTYYPSTGTINLEAGSTFNINNTATAYFRSLGNLQGNVNVTNGASLYVESNSLQGTLTVTNSSASFTGSTLNTTTILTNASLTFIDGSIVASSLTIPSGSAITFTNTTTINSSQTVTNNGTINISSGAILQGAATNVLITNNSAFNNSGELTVYNFTNNGTFTGNIGSTLASINITNNSTINLNSDSYLKMIGSGNFTNNGLFTHGNYTTRIKGRIFPQVPSSASWGNALL